MRKLIFILILFWAVSLMAQGVHYPLQVQSNADADMWYIVATADDTSNVYVTREIMSLWVRGYDAHSSTTETDIDFTFQVNPDTSLQSDAWTTEGTYTLDADSTWERWNITSTPIGAGFHWRLIGTGGASNTSDTCYVEVLFKGYQSTRR
jgi:hypothetical protein